MSKKLESYVSRQFAERYPGALVMVAYDEMCEVWIACVAYRHRGPRHVFSMAVGSDDDQFSFRCLRSSAVTRTEVYATVWDCFSDHMPGCQVRVTFDRDTSQWIVAVVKPRRPTHIYLCNGGDEEQLPFRCVTDSDRPSIVVPISRRTACTI